MTQRLGQQAIVIGGSIAGLTAARVLAAHFDRVIVLERDALEQRPAVHKSTPQGNHIHTLLLGGLQAMSSLYPGFVERLHKMGAVPIRAMSDFAIFFGNGVSAAKTFSLSGTVKEPRDFGFNLYSQSRELLEHCIRECTLETPNLTLWSAAMARQLDYDAQSVRGVRCGEDGREETLAADLVVDAGGRGSHAPRWLKEMGFEAPEETSIGCDFAYSSARFRLPDYSGEPERYLLFVGPPPRFTNGAIMAPIENDIWQVSLGGRFGDYPPADEAGFMAYVKSSIPVPKLAELLRNAERVSPITHHRFPTSVQRHYERLGAFPERLIVLGDAVSSFNPVYGQGMSSAVLQVKQLEKLLGERAANGGGLEGLAAGFFPRAADVISAPWILAAGADFAFPQTKGERPPNLAEGRSYFAALDALTAEDPEVHRMVFEVFGLVRPLSALTSEPLLSRVLAFQQRRANAKAS